MKPEWDSHYREWRDPTQVIGQWYQGDSIKRELLQVKTEGPWWELLEQFGITLLVTREYEHLVMGLSAAGGSPCITYLPLPHPSGIAVDRRTRTVHVASTRSPNQLYALRPAPALMSRDGETAERLADRPLLPVRTTLFPGCLYIHDIVFAGNSLYASAVAENAIVKLSEAGGSYKRVWWPKCIERRGKPDFSTNYLQLNSIASKSGRIRDGYFTASADRRGQRRPGHKNFPVDGRGVVFSGRTREPVVRDLTRPHSARFHRDRLWIANSGYGEVVTTNGEGFDSVRQTDGWTRGLTFHKNVGYVGVSQVIPWYSQYAPGLDVARSWCGIEAFDLRSGERLARLIWPQGNQIFAVEWVPSSWSAGLPYVHRGSGRKPDAERLFSRFELQ